VTRPRERISDDAAAAVHGDDFEGQERITGKRYGWSVDREIDTTHGTTET